jgi:hypothetical protein
MTTNSNQEKKGDVRSFTIPFTISITYQQVKDLLCSALEENGSDYWVNGISYNYPEGQSSKDYPHIKHRSYELPLEPDCSISILYRDGVAKVSQLNLELITKGINIMADKFYSHFSDFINGKNDSVTADVFLQCCLFGCLIF